MRERRGVANPRLGRETRHGLSHFQELDERRGLGPLIERERKLRLAPSLAIQGRR